MRVVLGAGGRSGIAAEGTGSGRYRRRLDARPADHDRGDRRGRQDDARARAARRAARARRRRRCCCASPAASPPSERIRTLVKDPALQVGARAEALLYAAARAQLVEEALAPALARRPLGPARPLRRLLARLPGRRPRARGRARCARSTRSRPAACAPDRTLLLRIDPALGRARQDGRGEAPDRLEREADGFFAAIAAAYDALAAAEPQRIRALDASAAAPSRARRRRWRRSRTCSPGSVKRMPSTTRPISGQVVFVTGAARGIGAAAARQLAARGAKLALVGLEPDELREGRRRLRPRRRLVRGRRHRHRARSRRRSQGTVERFGGIDVVIANAGIATGGSVRDDRPGRLGARRRGQPARQLAHRARGAAARDRAPRLRAAGRLRGGDRARAVHVRLLRQQGRRRGVRRLPAHGGRARSASTSAWRTSRGSTPTWCAAPTSARAWPACARRSAARSARRYPLSDVADGGDGGRRAARPRTWSCRAGCAR